MSNISIDEKISSIKNIDNIDNHSPIQNNNEKIMKYKNLDDEFNMVSLKSRYTLQKINSLMEENKDEDINLDEITDPKNSEYKNKILEMKIIQYYCTNKNDKNDFIPPSESIMKKIRQFKKWQNYEINKKNGFKNYLDNLMPDYKMINKTKKLLDDKIKLFTKIKIKPKSDVTILPKINNNYLNNEKENESNIFYDISNNYHKRLIHNRSMDEVIKNSFSISKINQTSLNTSKFNNNTINAKHKKKRKISTISNIRNSSLIRLLDNSKKLDSKINNSKEIKSFEKSVFCLNKSLVPMSIDKSVITTPFGGGLLHCNSLMRNKNINDLVPYYSPKRVQEKLRDYKNKRSRVIHNKDYIYHIGHNDHTFITNSKNYNYYDYLVF
jgi:hypothetical protein